jgi:hypothetical protein
MQTDSSEIRWLFLIHQIPPKPGYFRVKIWRRLQQIGAVAIKQSVYALPKTDQTYEDMLWILKEINDGGGEASLSEALLLEGLTDQDVEMLFQNARNADYIQLADEARSLAETLASEVSTEDFLKAKSQLSRLKQQFQDIITIDFFKAPQRETAEKAIADIESQMRQAYHKPPEKTKKPQNSPKRCTWVTRKGVYVDRIASAWLIRRFIDREARFKFVSAKQYPPAQNELRFDMSDAEFTHKGDICTFEVLMEKFGLETPELIHISELIHNIDMKDQKFDRSETAGISALFSGIALSSEQDELRLERGFVVLDGLYEYFLKSPPLSVPGRGRWANYSYSTP